MPLPPKLAERLYDTLNELEARVGSPMPPAMRAHLHDTIEAHYQTLCRARRRRGSAVFGVIAATGGLLGGVTVMGSHPVFGSLVIGVCFASGIVNAFCGGRAHEEVKNLDGEVTINACYLD